MESRRAAFIPGTDPSRAHREEGGKVKITCRALQCGEGAHTVVVSKLQVISASPGISLATTARFRHCPGGAEQNGAKSFQWGHSADTAIHFHAEYIFL